MFIQVRASNPPHKGTYTPGRFWANGVTYRIEVVANAIALAQLKPQARGREDVEARKLEIASGPFLPDSTSPDPDRITEAGLAFIKLNQHLSVLGDNDTQGALGGAVVEAARAAATKAGADLLDAQLLLAEMEENAKQFDASYSARLAELNTAREENDKLKIENTALTTRVAELELQATELAAAAVAAPPAPTATPEEKPAPSDAPASDPKPGKKQK